MTLQEILASIIGGGAAPNWGAPPVPQQAPVFPMGPPMPAPAAPPPAPPGPPLMSPFIQLRADRPKQEPWFAPDFFNKTFEPGTIMSGIFGTGSGPERPNTGGIFETIANLVAKPTSPVHEAIKGGPPMSMGSELGNAAASLSGQAVSDAASAVRAGFTPSSAAAGPVPTAPGPLKYSLAASAGAPSLPGGASASGSAPTTFHIPGTGAAPAPADPMSMAAAFLRRREGFRDSPYWDVNADRVGYGSDTVTLPDGTVQRVGKGTKVTQDDAERDLQRRLGETFQTLRTTLGEETFGALPAGAQAALASVYYNYGRIPDDVAAAAKSGDPQVLAGAIAARGTDNNGVNKSRRLEEAQMVLGGAGGDPRLQLSAGNIPMPPTLQGPVKTDLSEFMALLKGAAPQRQPPREFADRITALLGGMAAGAKNARPGIHNLMLGAGAGTAGAATGLTEAARKEDREFFDAQQRFQMILAEAAKVKATTEAAFGNASVDTNNRNAAAIYDRNVAQAANETKVTNELAKTNWTMDVEALRRGEPQVVRVEDGFMVTRRGKDGSISGQIFKTGDKSTLFKGLDTVRKSLGDDNPLTQQLEYQILRDSYGSQPQLADAVIREQLAKDLVKGGQPSWEMAFGKTGAANLLKQIDKGIPPEYKIKPEMIQKAREEGVLQALRSNMQKLPDTWLEYLAQNGHMGAKLYLSEAQRK